MSSVSIRMTKEEFSREISENEAFFDRIDNLVSEGISVIELIDDVLRDISIESWEVDPCLVSYLKEIGEEIPEEADEDFWWDVLWEAIEYYKKKDGWRGYIYVPPHVSGISMGATLWYK